MGTVAFKVVVNFFVLAVEESKLRHQTVAVTSQTRQPNVAVITLKNEECLEGSDADKKKNKKSITKKKRRVTLDKQV